MLPLSLLIFFSSGFAALLYQVIWQRSLAYYSGADVYSITIIVSAFMAGLGCGSLVGGYLADRLSAIGRIKLFAAAELGIAGFAYVSITLYTEILYNRLSAAAASPVLLPVVLFAAVLWPTFLMGMSLPLLSRTVTERIDQASRTVGALYMVNTLGAAAGAFVTTWFLMRRFGFETTVLIGATLNLFAAAAALLLVSFVSRRAAPRENSRDMILDVASGPTAWFPPRVWIAIYGISGFVALSMQILWFRLLGTIAKPTAFVFGNLLGMFLTGLALGTFAGIWLAPRARNPSRLFLSFQSLICLYCGFSLVALVTLLPQVGILSETWSHLSQYEPADLADTFTAISSLVRGESLSGTDAYILRQFFFVYLAIPGLIIGPPTVLMGLSFPVLQRAVQSDLAKLGRRVGWLQTANIAGSMLGASLTGWLALGLIGTAGTIKVLVLFSLLFLGLLAAELRRAKSRIRGPVMLSIAAVMIAVALPDNRRLWAVLHGTTEKPVIVAEDGTGVSLLKGGEAGFSGETIVYVNGLGQSEIPFSKWHIALGMIPVMLHDDPRNVAIIGLGSGATLFGAGGREETTNLTSIEIVGPQLRTLRQLSPIKRDDGLASVLSDGRISFVTADGRRHLAFDSTRYDIIEADALRPTSAYSGNLYSIQYFELVKQRLAPGGFAVSWAPTQRVVDTFIKVLPYSMRYTDEYITMMIGSDTPFEWDPGKIIGRLRSAAISDYYSVSGTPVNVYIEAIKKSRVEFFDASFDRSRLHDLNSDLFPRDEFLVRGGSR